MDIPHIGFIVAAYALAFVTVGAMIAMVLIDYRDLTARLREFEAGRGKGDGA